MDTERSTADNPWGLEPLLDVRELADNLGVPISTVYDWRTRGIGPRREGGVNRIRSFCYWRTGVVLGAR